MNRKQLIKETVEAVMEYKPATVSLALTYLKIHCIITSEPVSEEEFLKGLGDWLSEHPEEAKALVSKEKKAKATAKAKR